MVDQTACGPAPVPVEVQGIVGDNVDSRGVQHRRVEEPCLSREYREFLRCQAPAGDRVRGYFTSLGYAEKTSLLHANGWRS